MGYMRLPILKTGEFGSFRKRAQQSNDHEPGHLRAATGLAIDRVTHANQRNTTLLST